MDSPKVIFVSAEATPFIKVGGLADVAGSLPRALRRQGVDVRLILPRYATVSPKKFGLRRLGSIPVPVGNGETQVHLLGGDVDGLPVYMIWDDQYFSAREKVYGFNDDAQRFAFFARAVIATLTWLEWKPDLIHANDWHAAPIVAWLRHYGRKRDDFFAHTASLFTIHNIAYQGLCGRLILSFARMRELPHLEVEPPGKVNWMAQGIANADMVNTVSPTYAREILEAEAGAGLHELLRQRHAEGRLYGILNGLDTELWNPATDSALPQPFNRDTLPLRRVNKAALQRELGLPAQADVPMLGTVTRLDSLKGVDILLPAIETLLGKEPVQFVLLGTGQPEYEEHFRDLQAHYPHQVRAVLRFDERLARRIYGSIDLFLMPSRFEPCGLGQMIAMRYGVPPLVRATGGLADTVIDVDENPYRGTGFVFHPYTPEALLATLQRALQAYADKKRWTSLQRRAMERDFSWDASAHAYADLYQQTIHTVRKGG